MSWVDTGASVAIGDINGTHADVYLQYDDSSSNPRSCRLYVVCRQYHSIYVYFDNIAFNDGAVVVSRILVNTASTAVPWSGSLNPGSYYFKFSCPWDSGTAYYTSTSGTVPSANVAPTTPTVSVASNNTSNSLDITWGTSSFGYPTSGTAYIYSGTSASPTQMQYSKTTTGNSLWTNTNLTANTLYYYRARAKNTADLWSSYSADATGVVKAATATVSLSSYDSASATISYSASADGGYYDRYIQYSLDGTNWSNAVTITGGSADSGTFTVSGLNPSTSYTIRTRMTTTAGSLNGSSISVTTKAAVALYGSVNGQTKKIAKLYGSVNGETKLIKKLYASVNGVTKKVYEG